MAPSCFSRSPYRAIWTHFRPNPFFLIKQCVILGFGLDQCGRQAGGAGRVDRLKQFSLFCCLSNLWQGMVSGTSCLTNYAAWHISTSLLRDSTSQHVTRCGQAGIHGELNMVWSLCCLIQPVRMDCGMHRDHHGRMLGKKYKNSSRAQNVSFPAHPDLADLLRQTIF